MTRTQIQLPDPLFRRLEEVATMHNWSLEEVLKRAAEQYVDQHPVALVSDWQFPTIESCGGFVNDPATMSPEVDAIIDPLRS